MAREGIRFEQVAAAADALLSEGQQPTIRAIRDRLGSGSPNTIHKHLSFWRETHPPVTAAAPELPQALKAAIAAEIERAAAQVRTELEGHLARVQLEAGALAVAGEQLEADLLSLKEKVSDLTRERDTVAGKAEQLAAEIERLRAALDDAQHGRTDAQQQAAVLAAQLQASAERAARAEARVEQIERQAAQTAQAREEALERAARLEGRLEALTAKERKSEERP